MNKHVRKTTHPKVNVRLMTIASNTWLSHYLVESLNSVGTFQVLVHIVIPYGGKLLREKTFANFTVLWLFAKVSPQNFGGIWHAFAWQKGAIHESFLHKNCSWRIDVQPPGTMTVWTLFFFKLSDRINEMCTEGVHY